MSAHDAGIYALDTVTQHYAWGSRTALAELAGRPSPSALPEAELWVGAHPQGPSRVRGSSAETLAERIDRDATFALGDAVRERFGARLPLLLKVLAAERPLSLQTHPPVAQAIAGFAREEALGIARDAPERTYRDANHKPELLCALTPFDALCGFRDVDELLREVQPALGSSLYRAHLGPVRSRHEGGLAWQLKHMLETPRAKVAEIAAELLAGAERLVRERGPHAPLGEWLLRVHESYGPDPGLLVVPLMNLVRLAPGDAVYLPAGNLHAYLRGTGVEVMASSDNVLRGGLTPKHMDVGELTRVLDFQTGRAPYAPSRRDRSAHNAFVYETPAKEFELSRVELRSAEPSLRATVRGPELLLCTRGACVLRGGDGSHAVELRAGEAAFVAHGAERYALVLHEAHDEGVVFRARVPLEPVGAW